MIEIFKSRRYIGLCIVLVVLCVIVMIFEGLFTGDKHSHIHNVVDHPPAEKERQPPDRWPADGTDNGTKQLLRPSCYLREDFHIITPCTKCSDMTPIGNFTACKKTGFVEQIRCRSGTRVVRTCVHHTAVTSFFQFEVVMIIISIAGWFFTRHRESLLTKAAIDRINKQISSGV